MNTNNLLIICLIILIAVVIILLIIFLIIQNKNSKKIPEYRKKEIDFEGGADTNSGIITSHHNQIISSKVQGTIILQMDGNILGVNQTCQPEIIRIRRMYDNVVFDIDISEGATLGRIQAVNSKGYYCVTTMSDVSKYHCVLRMGSGGEIMIRDNNSTNHTYVNGMIIEIETPIRRGDIFRLGHKCEFMIM